MSGCAKRIVYSPVSVLIRSDGVPPVDLRHLPHQVARGALLPRRQAHQLLHWNVQNEELDEELLKKKLGINRFIPLGKILCEGLKIRFLR